MSAVVARRVRLAAAAAVPVGFLVLTYAWPLVAILRRSADGAAEGVVADTLTDPRIVRIGLVTVAQAVLSTLLAVVVGVPAAWVYARLDVPGRRWAWGALAVPFVMPTVVIAAGFLAVTGAPAGGADPVRWVSVLAAHVALNVGVVARTVGARIAAIDPALEWTARSLGRSALGAAWAVSVRGARDAVTGSALVVFLFCLTSFGVVVVLGSGAVTTVEVEVWFLATRLFRLDAAAVLAVAQLAFIVGVLAVYEWRRRPPGPPVTVPGARRRPSRPLEWVVAGAALAVPLGFALVPVGALVVRSLRVGDSWGLSNYRNLFRPLGTTALPTSPAAALGNSMLIATVAALLALAVAVPATVVLGRPGRGAKVLDLAMMLPLATSAATVGFGLLVAYRSPPLDLRGSWWAVPLVEASIAVPLVVRVLAPLAAGIDRDQLAAGATLGAGPWRRARRLVVPLVRPGLALGGSLAFAVALGEFGAVSFLARADAPTIPQVIARLLARPGESNYGQAMALGVLLAGLSGAVFAAGDAIGRGRSLQF